MLCGPPRAPAGRGLLPLQVPISDSWQEALEGPQGSCRPEGGGQGARPQGPASAGSPPREAAPLPHPRPLDSTLSSTANHQQTLLAPLLTPLSSLPPPWPGPHPLLTLHWLASQAPKKKFQFLASSGKIWPQLPPSLLTAPHTSGPLHLLLLLPKQLSPRTLHSCSFPLLSTMPPPHQAFLDCPS